jgi:hypothetical protein
MRKTACIDEEAPQGIGHGFSIHVFESTDPNLSGSTVKEHQAAGTTARRDAVSIADVHANNIESFEGSAEATTLAAAFNVDDASK